MEEQLKKCLAYLEKAQYYIIYMQDPNEIKELDNLIKETKKLLSI